MAVYIITHKKFKQPEVAGYRSLLVGAYKGHAYGDLFDDVGDNISDKNPSFCELTGLYWLWKNIKDAYIGIVHYRRFFSKSLRKRKILSETSIQKKLRKYDMIVPNKINIFQPVGEQLMDSYNNNPELLRMVRGVLLKLYPEYVGSFDKVMSETRTYFCNMMICSKQMFDDYCKWLFDILFDIEKRICIDEFDDYQKRIYGFLSERLLTVWIEKNNLNVCELGIINTEKDDGKLKELLKGMRRVYSYYIPQNTNVERLIDIVRKKFDRTI